MMNNTVKNTENTTIFEKVLNFLRQAFSNENLALLDQAEYYCMAQCI